MTTAHPNLQVFWAGLFLIVAAFTVTAQEFRGSLAGKITDPNGAVVPGSKVEIKNVETGIVTTTTTGEDGSYSFALLPPGRYQLTVTKENFNTAVRDGVVVRVADRLTLDGSPNYAFDGGVGFSPPSDAVQEFKVQTNTFGLRERRRSYRQTTVV